MSNAMYPIIRAFNVLRARSIIDPLYTRLHVQDEWERDRWGWLYRQADRVNRPLETGEVFDFTVTDGRRWADVSIEWVPIFDARIRGSDADVRFARWFLCQGPRIAGGSHLLLDGPDGEWGDNPSWDLATWDYLIVRCGSYCHAQTGRIISRMPSRKALAWVADPQRFLTSERNRRRVLALLSAPDENGDWYTIRRVFHDGIPREHHTARSAPALRLNATDASHEGPCGEGRKDPARIS